MAAGTMLAGREQVNTMLCFFTRRRARRVVVDRNRVRSKHDGEHEELKKPLIDHGSQAYNDAYHKK